jgi:hypothetical protein
MKLHAKEYKVVSIFLSVVIVGSAGILLAHRSSEKNVEIDRNWSYKENLPAPRIQGGAVASGGQIYYVGGRGCYW